MTKCSFDDCTKPATCVPKIHVPSTGHAGKPENCLTGIMNVPLCFVHCCEFDTKGTLEIPGSPLKNIFENLAKGKVPPDFTRAYVMPVSLTSDEYKDLPQLQGKVEEEDN